MQLGREVGTNAAHVMRRGTASQWALSRRTFAMGLGASLIVRRAGAEGSNMNHVVLIGDSVFDNGAYVAGGPDLVRQLRNVLPGNWRATLNAVDGAVIASVPAQLARLPADATHLVVSIGGNDALREAAVLDAGARSVADALAKLTDVRERFGRDYAEMLGHVARLALPTAICTIYEPRFPEADRRRIAATALTMLNDCITREAFARALPLLDLRLICNNDADFANPIEPSSRGGAKLAEAIVHFVTGTGGLRSPVIAG
jgi:lysophospholipase L1-like esterase